MRINPRNFFKRKLEHIPPHFTKMNVKWLPDHSKEILARWIYANCNGRFGITAESVIEDNQVKTVTMLGFEEPSDMTLFALAGMAQISQ